MNSIKLFSKNKHKIKICYSFKKISFEQNIASLILKSTLIFFTINYTLKLFFCLNFDFF